MTKEASEQQQAQYRNRCNFRRDGKKIEEKTPEGWELMKAYQFVNEAKRDGHKPRYAV